MIERKKKILFIQLALLIVGITMFYLTYYDKKSDLNQEIIIKESIKGSNKESSPDEDIFYNIEYTGSDFSGNRYILKAEEAYLDKERQELVYMNNVHAVFYFKDDTTLDVKSDTGVYNNKNLDMKFRKNVRSIYLESVLFAEKAEYSNSENYLTIYENVRLNDKVGKLIADKLLFDIKKKKLDITSFKDGSINANVKLNEKRF